MTFCSIQKFKDEKISLFISIESSAIDGLTPFSSIVFLYFSHFYTVLFFPSQEPSGVLSIINHLKPGKATRPDRISPNTYKASVVGPNTPRNTAVFLTRMDKFGILL